MQEADIRPAEMFKESLRLDQVDIARVLAHRSQFVRVSCPACDSALSEPAFEKSGFLYERCGECRTLYVNPRPSMEVLSEHYRNSLTIEYWNENIYPASEEVRRNNIFAPRARRVVEICKARDVGLGSLLDIGAGFGTFLEELQKLNLFEALYAVEPSSKLADTCRKKGLAVMEELAENLKIDAPVDVITNFELIEHLFEPLAFLKHCHRLLKPGGLMILTTPNILGFDLLVLGALSDNIGAPNHINYFNPLALKILMQSAGFTVLETLTPGELDVDIVKNKIKSGEFDVSTSPFLKEVLVERGDSLGGAFQKFLADNLLSSHMWVVAQRI